MKRKATAKRPRKAGLVIRSQKDGPLGKTQQQFNRLMKDLEKTRERHAQEQARLDEALDVSIAELMPMVEQIKRLNLEIVMHGVKALKSMKLSPHRKHWFENLLHGKASILIADPIGLTVDDIKSLETLADELGPNEEDGNQLDAIRAMVEAQARAAGVDMDLGDLDLHRGREEFERQLRERLAEAAQATKPKTPRKLTKAQAERERKRHELEQARNRDLKSLFKQLAKAFHPDLESDPVLRQHKEVWMKRLNSAYESDDLREMLQLEMEWLGEESTNLASASDEKLHVYCSVLKEQIEELKKRTHLLLDEPQYSTLRRFRNPTYGTLANPKTIRQTLEEELNRHREILGILSANNANSRHMVHAWADANAQASQGER